MRNNEQAIQDLVKTWHEATAAGEVARVLPLMADDVIFLTQGNPPLRGRQDFGQALTTLLQDHQVKSSVEILEIQVSGDLAYCWSYLTVTVTSREGGLPMRRAGNTLTILRKQFGGEWAVVRDANMLAPVPASGS